MVFGTKDLIIIKVNKNSFIGNVQVFFSFRFLGEHGW